MRQQARNSDTAEELLTDALDDILARRRNDRFHAVACRENGDALDAVISLHRHRGAASRLSH